LISDCYQKVAKLQDENKNLKSFIHSLEKENEKLNSSSKDAPLLAKPEKSVETEFVNEETSALPELPSCIPDSNCYVENEQKSVDEVDVYQELFTEEEMTSTELTPMPQIADETRGFPSDLPHVDPICQPKWDSDESLDEDEPAVQQEKNEAVADESSSLSGFCEVKPSTDETQHTESNGIVEALSVPNTFEDSHVCFATCSPISEPVGLMPEATAESSPLKSIAAETPLTSERSSGNRKINKRNKNKRRYSKEMRADGILEKAVARIDKMEQVVVGTFGACKSMVSACLADWLPTSFCYEEPGNYSRTGEDQTCCQKSKEETLMSEAANVSDSQKPLGVAGEKRKEKNRRKKNNSNNEEAGDSTNF
jgi:hypothetical protein